MLSSTPGGGEARTTKRDEDIFSVRLDTTRPFTERDSVPIGSDLFGSTILMSPEPSLLTYTK